MKKDVIGQYTQMAKDYDETIRKLVPGYDKVMKLMIDFLTFDKSQVIDILDIGSGTGNLALLLKKKFFYSQITCLDATKKMLQSAKQKLSEYQGINYECKHIQEFPFNNKYDVVFVSMVFQNLANKRRKFLIYKKIFKALKKNGIFIMFSPVKAPNKFIEEYYMKKWGKFIQKSFSKKRTADGWRTTYAEKDDPDTFLDEIDMLKRSGFKYVDVLYKQYNMAIFTAMNFNIL